MEDKTARQAAKDAKIAKETPQPQMNPPPLRYSATGYDVRR
jgi:hypothetical protein